MKRILPIILLVALAISLTSCNPDTAAKLGELMGKMGNNVYGITANMKDVNDVTAAVNNSVKAKADGTYDVDTLMEASSVVDSIYKIKDSKQKTDQLKENLSQPVASSSTERTNLVNALGDAKAALVDKVTDIESSPYYTEMTTSQKSLVASVKESLNRIPISSDPTKAEVVTIAILNDIADSVADICENLNSYVDSSGGGWGLTSEGVEIVGDTLMRLETLKTITDFGGLDLLAGISPSAIMDSFSERGAATRGDVDEFASLIDALGNPIAKFVNLLVDENHEFSESKWNTFVFQARSIKATYELIGCLYLPLTNSGDLHDLDVILDYDIEFGLTMDDFVLYFISVLSCLAGEIKEESEVWVDGFEALINTNVDNMMAYNGSGDIPDIIIPTEFNAAYEKLQDKVDDFKGNSWAVLATVAVILNDSGYKSILKLNGGTGHVCDIYNMITGDTI